MTDFPNWHEREQEIDNDPEFWKRAFSRAIKSWAKAVSERDDIFIDVLNQEIKWCMDNPDGVLSKDFQKGYINGLIQAKYLIGMAKALTLVGEE